MVRTRFAPSPTGDLHLGGAWVALASWVYARRAGGAFVVRMEDLDTPRVVKGSAERILDDLRWLGLDWDEGPGASGPYGPYVQSARVAFYDAAAARLAALGRTYECDCSRAEIARVASAPHEGEERLYPGTCRDRGADAPFRRMPCVRARVPEGARLHFDDLVVGDVEQEVSAVAGDFVLRRADGIVAYQLAVALDDSAMKISHVFRGDDLLSSTPRQLLLLEWLGLPTPRYGHLPLVVAHDGSRLAKRSPAATIAQLRAAGLSPPDITGALGFALGLSARPGPASPSELAADPRGSAPRALVAWPRTPWAVPAAWVNAAGSTARSPARC